MWAKNMTWKRHLTVWFLAAGGLLLALAGCSNLEAPPALSDEEVFDTPNYAIAPLDTLQIFVWRSPELSVTVPVRPDGRISIPLVEDLQAAGKTPSVLARSIESALRPFIQNPKASVVVEQFADNSAQAVRVLGEVKQPAAVPYRPHITVLDVLVAAGGLTEFADGNSAKLIRRGENGTGQSYRLELQDLLIGGEMNKNAKLRPGDLIVVPQSLI
jgi:polysaccharide export outer membrane protein